MKVTTVVDDKESITEYLMGYYSNIHPHHYNCGFTPNESERLYWAVYKL
jgi:putative transposase